MRGAVDGGELLLGAGRGPRTRAAAVAAGAGQGQPGAADRGGRVGAVVAAEPPGLPRADAGREPPADLGQELGAAAASDSSPMSS